MLKQACDDWSTVESRWADTRLIRQHLKLQRKDQINVFLEYPCLSGNRATNLVRSLTIIANKFYTTKNMFCVQVAADFTSVYSNAKAINDVWPNLRGVFEKFIQSKSIIDEFSQTLLNELPKLVEG